ncbi:metalloprotease, putative [Ixodes scapularis]|uniref:Metalloprotease, putative n=1 Tax=Ixodes scapularis TaxID=6945 RepID=B7PPE9_IXOSC|nr:metalloprotease, putative [Ixodes scapularis]|eukprot:XP_002435641.1 metalloprotease, putative [Ixodes scapularis]
MWASLVKDTVSPRSEVLPSIDPIWNMWALRYGDYKYVQGSYGGGTTTPLYYMPLFETETEVYPEVLHYGDENTVVQIVEGYELHLHHTAIFPPRVLVRTFKDGEPIDRVMRTTDIRKEIFCDDSNGATLMIRRNRESNQTTVEGIIDNELRIMPNKDPNAKKNSHKVYRVKDKSSHVLDSTNKTIFVRPEVVVIVDSAHASRFRSRGDLLRYMGVFMNAPDQETYFKYTGNHVNADQTLAGFTLRLATGYIPGNFDFAYLLTGRDIAQVTQSGSVHPAVAGVAYIGGACTVQRTGMGEDVPGTYDGVHVATHEMAHLMGCVHDGDPPPDYLSDSPGAQDCPWDDGFIMSYKDGGQNHYMFSQCCVAQIKHLLQRGSHNCLLEQYNRPLKMDKRLPGELLSPVDYCRLRFPEIPYVWTDANPADLMQCKIRCSYPVNPYTGLYVYRQANALDGTTCAEGKRCINGVCG